MLTKLSMLLAPLHDRRLGSRRPKLQIVVLPASHSCFCCMNMKLLKVQVRSAYRSAKHVLQGMVALSVAFGLPITSPALHACESCSAIVTFVP